MPIINPIRSDDPEDGLENVNTNGKIFFGREEELSKLYDLTIGQRSRLGTVTIMVTGVGGVGKSALVEAFVMRHFSPPELIRFNLENNSDPIKVEDAIKERRRQFPRQRLVVILDGAGSLNSKQADFGIYRLSTLKSIRTLIVTARAAPRLRGVNYINLSNLSLPDSVLLLTSYFDNRISNEDIVRLATALNGNPLALNLVVEFLKTHSIDEVWKFIEGDIYNLGFTSRAETKELIQAVQPKIILVNDSVIRRLQKSPEDIYKITPRQFEEIIAELLSNMGWDVELTQETRDGGKDILAYMNTEIGRFLCLVEAKRHRKKRPVGVGIIRNLYGTFCDYQANSAMLVTSSHFSDDSKDFQKKHSYQLSLKEYKDVVNWIQKYKA